MLMLHTLHHFILAGACLCVCGSPVQQDPAARGGAPKTSKSRDGSHVSGLVLEVGAGSRGPAWRHGGVAVLLQNRDSLHVESRLSTSDMRRGTQEAAGTGSLKKGNLEAVLTSPRTRTPRDKEDRQDGDQDAQTRQISSTEHPNTSFGIHSPASSSTIPPSTSPPTFTPLPLWDNEGALMATPPEALLPDIEPNMMPKEDGMESLWTEAARPGGDTAAPPSQDDATEGTMSSESLPLIFEPLEESVEDGAPLPTAAMATGGAPLSEADLELLVTWETDKGASQLGTVQTSDFADNEQVTMTTHPTVHKSQSGLDEMESEEDPDDEHSEESVEEEESEEDLIETTKTSLTQPPYSLIPPPPIWVQRNQGLMRSWVALIREKAGYVSGMLAPVGIGIAGALLIVGALYGVRRLQRKRRNSFKHQRRKVRQAEQPREVDTSRQDQAMLLADSSEDEF
ncbi:armadillo-like helical domain-containing protein 4 isoform X2 [Dunckerocampus dactyliophorus]|uniref:armadillo-like helical domain-containing protein 4 isoform X2 n=1 Tax=Dunckerocampus dactyliophorus TaxID=161453 RepID=UPI002406D718|nr:armadillo-like helical domain-containing protein 4 isoform X2 [Dunckerocampus dactyliophorus]